MSVVTAIFTAAVSRAPVSEQPAVQVRAGGGIVGDRNYRRNNQPANQITLIEQEAIDAFNQAHRLAVPASALRRNLLTRGVDLNALEGREFTVGTLRLRGIELCEPCAVIGKLLQQPDLSPTQVIQALMGRGGLRAEILDTGVIRVGDPVIPHA
ncbi:MOSC domain-containing protein [Isoalcanivorax indicus]|uniref:MOSC domain-containing protein n=1 Tax=Isoalcanivorax indicus TaxID=2202653 RepID=UPI000DBA1F1D|nr:MOSC domain-containing protein [Isoalcanivorax indicus]